MEKINCAGVKTFQQYPVLAPIIWLMGGSTAGLDLSVEQNRSAKVVRRFSWASENNTTPPPSYEVYQSETGSVHLIRKVRGEEGEGGGMAYFFVNPFFCYVWLLWHLATFDCQGEGFRWEDESAHSMAADHEGGGGNGLSPQVYMSFNQSPPSLFDID